MQKVLVTGASGFIGGALCVSLLKRQVQVMGLFRKASPVLEKLALYPHFTPCLMDLAQNIPALTDLAGVEIIFHLAGLAHAGPQAHLSLADYRNINVNASLRLLEQAAQAGVKRMVFFSSVKAIQPEDDYGLSKQEAEQALLALAKTLRIEVVILRPALVYGPSLKGNLREMQTAIRQGWFPPLPETGNRRSLVSVQDVVTAAWVVAEHPKVVGQSYVVTDQQVYSSRQIYEVLCHTVGKKPWAWSVPAGVLSCVTGLLGKKALYEKLLGSADYRAQSFALSEDTGWAPSLRFQDYQYWWDGDKTGY